MTNDKGWQGRSDEWVKATEKSRKEKEQRAKAGTKKCLLSPSNGTDRSGSCNKASGIAATDKLENLSKSKR